MSKTFVSYITISYIYWFTINVMKLNITVLIHVYIIVLVLIWKYAYLSLKRKCFLLMFWRICCNLIDILALRTFIYETYLKQYRFSFVYFCLSPAQTVSSGWSERKKWHLATGRCGHPKKYHVWVNNIDL